MENAINRVLELGVKGHILAVESQGFDVRLPGRLLRRTRGETSRAAPPRPKREKRS